MDHVLGGGDRKRTEMAEELMDADANGFKALMTSRKNNRHDQ